MAYYLFIISLCYVAFCDITKRKILNNSVILVFAFGFLFVLKGSEGFSSGFLESVVAGIFVFLCFYVFYVLGWMGAGDVKLGCVLAFCFGGKFFFLIWIVSISLSIFYSVVDLFLRGYGWEISRGRWMNNEVNLKAKHIPYGLFLSVASILHLFYVF